MEELDTLDANVAEILGVRAEIIERLREEFEGKDTEIRFDDATGSVRPKTSTSTFRLQFIRVVNCKPWTSASTNYWRQSEISPRAPSFPGGWAK